jgi:ApaG protein
MNTFVKVPAGVASGDVVVRVVSSYVPQESDPPTSSGRRYVFAYHIEIENRGGRTVKLLSRHWWIVDARDRVDEVEGQGVIGQQPVILPGQTFSYSSWCVLATPTGRMRGVYSMLAEGGEVIEVPIPQFVLTASTMLN